MTHKFGIRLPKTVEEALDIDKATDTDFWRKAVNKEMAKVKIAWKTNDGLMPQQARQGQVPDLIAFGCHTIFLMSRWTSRGRLNSLPEAIAYHVTELNDVLKRCVTRQYPTRFSHSSLE
jgi:hypothetical protein